MKERKNSSTRIKRKWRKKKSVSKETLRASRNCFNKKYVFFLGLNAISRLKRVAQFSHCPLKDSTASIPSTTFCFFHFTKITRVTPKSFQFRHANSKCPMKSTNIFTSYKTQSYFTQTHLLLLPFPPFS